MRAKRGKKKDPNAPIRPWAALITWLLLNVIWMAASPIGTPQPVLSEDGAHREFYWMTVPDVQGNTLRLEVDCDMTPASAEHEGVMVSWTLWNIEEKIASDALGEGDSTYAPKASYFGRVDKDCSRMNESVEPGEYELQIQFFYANGTKVARDDVERVVDAEFHMMYWIYEPLEKTGYLVANVLGFLILVTDQGARRFMKRRRLAALAYVPLHKQRHREEWDSLQEGMDGRGEAAVESFQIEMGSTSEVERERIRRQFADAAAATMDDDDEAIDEGEVVAGDEGLGEGTTVGLEGKTKVDKDIETVRDLYRRMEDDEDI
jgi:hypothetical protein